MSTFHHLQKRDRDKLEALLKVKPKHTVTEIAEALNCSRSTVYRELRRGRYERLDWEYRTVEAYSSDIAQQKHDYNAANKGAPLKIGNDIKLARHIEKKIISEHFSPAAVLGEIQEKQLGFHTRICVKTLYNYIDKDIFFNLTNDNLLQKAHRKREYNKIQISRIKKPLCRSIEERPDEINSRESFGHWEMDTVIGKAQGKGQVLLVLTERKTRMEIIRKLNGKTQDEVARALTRLEREFGSRFKKIFKTITIDNGSEFLNESLIEKSCRTKGNRTIVYYCHPFSSWERGSNENTNGMIRRFIPKGARMEDYTEEDIRYIEHWINNYPRKILHWKCANDLYQEELQRLSIA